MFAKFNRHQKLVIVTLFFAAVTGAMGVWHLSSQEVERENIAIDHQPILGNPHAPVTIVLFEDLKCTVCRDLHAKVLPAIKKRYVDTGKAKIAVILLPLYPGSRPLAIASLSLYQQSPERFFPFIEEMFLRPPTTTEPLFDEALSDRLDKNEEIAEKALHGDVGVPALFVNGIKVDAWGIGPLSKAIEEELQ